MIQTLPTKPGEFFLHEWFAYVHEKDHMLHNSLYNFGNHMSYTTFSDNLSRVTLHEIKRTEVTYLNEPRTPCEMKPRKQNMENCIQHHLEDTIGCQLPWNTDNTTLPKCIETIQYQTFLHLYDEIASLSGFSIAKRTGCLPSCKINEFTMTVQNTITMPKRSTYTGYFFYPGGRYLKKVYHYNYDFTSYVADVGGLVGLFLGFSMLGFYDGLKNAYKNKRL